MLTDAFEALKKLDWGTDLAAVAPIEEAAIAVPGRAAASQDLEQLLLASLKGDLSRDAHDYVCRKLALVGTAVCVPTLAGLLGNKATSHMARYALERINAPEAGQALRDALGTTTGNLKIGVISSVGARRDREAVLALQSVLRDEDPAVARAAAQALGTIGTSESAGALILAFQGGTGDRQSVIDGMLTCAESLFASGREADAKAIYKMLLSSGQGRLVRLAATRGLLACGAKQA